MNTSTQSTAPTLESVWASLQEIGRKQEENERLLTEKFAEMDKWQEDINRILTEKFAEIAIEMKGTYLRSQL